MGGENLKELEAELEGVEVGKQGSQDACVQKTFQVKKVNKL